MADSDPNVGIGTPIVGGPASSTAAAQPIPYTLLSLPRYARIMGINPVHFQGAYADNVWGITDNCLDLWTSRSWQESDTVSRYDLALAIRSAEDDIAKYLGYYPAPKWTSAEMHRYPKYHRPDSMSGGGWQFDTTPYQKSVFSKMKKPFVGGRRATTLIDTPTVAAVELVYSDEDGDSFYETATITVTTTVTDERELKVYHAGKLGNPDWEIRDPRSVTLAGGVATFVFDSWLFVDPNEQGSYPTHAEFDGIYIGDLSNFVTSVDVYREYTDDTSVSAQFFWEPTGSSICANCSLTINGSTLLPSGSSASSTSCPVCGFTAQNACMIVRDIDSGIVVPHPSTYDTDQGLWIIQSYAVARDPDIVKLWYRSGDVSDDFLAGYTTDPLSDFYAMAIAWMATARLERPPCSCGNLLTVMNGLRERPTSAELRESLDFAVLGNPFGTLRGELMAWARLSKSGSKTFSAYAI